MTKSHVLVSLGIGAAAFGLIALGFRSNENGFDTTRRMRTAVTSPDSALPARDSGAALDSAADLPFAVDPHTDYMSLGQVAFARREYAAAISHLQHAAQQDGSRFQVHYLLGLALRLEGRAAESLVAIEQALDLAPHDPRALVNYARTLLALDRAAEAELRVVDAIQIAPDDADAWNVLGRARLALGRSDAETALRRACELDPQNPYAQNNLGLVFLYRQAWDDAVQRFQSAIALEPGVAYFHNNLGQAFERLGRLDFAASAYARAVEIEPEHVAASHSLERVTPLLQAMANAFAATPADSTTPIAASNP